MLEKSAKTHLHAIFNNNHQSFNQTNWKVEVIRYWLKYWNSHDLAKILSLYSKDFELYSNEISNLMPGIKTIEGIAEAEKYWDLLFNAKPNLHFSIVNYEFGINQITIFYSLSSDDLFTEIMHFNKSKKICKSIIFKN